MTDHATVAEVVARLRTALVGETISGVTIMLAPNIDDVTTLLAEYERTEAARVSAERQLAEVRGRIKAAPKAKVRGKVGELATICVSHDLVGQRVAILPLADGDAT